MKKYQVFITFLLFVGSFIVFPEFVGASNDITSPDFTIDVSELAPGGLSLQGESTAETVDNVLMTILEKMIVIFGVLAVFIMTLGGGYMIIYHGQDDLLSRGKTIFVSGFIALAVALGAGLIVQLFAYLLY